ncbi:hypothetical protein NAT51_05105 [Flavobacterium amniphilum]|uniref:hypothetical protein n=1 Tax=Flavobacterium amniphilum TaxID=1834035 RepID=UPI00202AA9E1|nr:hypothetical protein [Flavobacterium amniphilum]MCL9804886.1 hypothetical protein [Flavobacterium amniphilum]
MKLPIILILFTLNILGQNAKTENNPEKMIMTSGSQNSRYKTVKIHNINFDLAVKNKDTVYLQTTDSKFITKEGIYVGKKLWELPFYIKQNLTKEDGWGFFYNLPSGWSIGFCEGKTCTENYPKDDSAVKWIFKRK